MKNNDSFLSNQAVPKPKQSVKKAYEVIWASNEINSCPESIKLGFDLDG